MGARRAPQRHRPRGEVLARRLRQRQLLFDIGCRRLYGAADSSLRRPAFVAAGSDAQLSRLAAGVRLRPANGRLVVRARRPPVHRRRDCASRLLRRDAAQRSSRHLDTAQPGAAGSWQGDAAEWISGVAAGHRAASSGRIAECFAGTPDGSVAAVAGERQRNPGGVDGRAESCPAEAGHPCGARGDRCGRDERRLWRQPANSADRLRAGAADRVREHCQPDAGAQRGATRADFGAAGAGGFARG